MRISDWSSDVCSSDLKVVHLLELIDVENQQPHPAELLQRPIDCRFQPLVEQHAVGKPGQRIMFGGPANLLFHQDMLVKVFGIAVPADDPAMRTTTGKAPTPHPTIANSAKTYPTHDATGCSGQDRLGDRGVPAHGTSRRRSG